MHILVLPSWFPEPGLPLQGSFFVDQARALARAGHKVGAIYPALRRVQQLDLKTFGRLPFTVSTCREGELEILHSHGFHLPRAGVVNPWLFAQQARRLFRRYTASHGTPDVIHAQCSMWAAWGAASIARRSQVPFIVTEHWSGFLQAELTGWRRRAVQLALSRASEILAVSRTLAAALTPYAPQGREIHVIPNTVDVELFRPAIRDSARSEFRVLTVCNLIPLKRVDLTIRAFAHAFGHDPCCMLEIVGHGSERRRLQDLAKATKLGDRIVFSGQLSRDHVRAAMQRADLFMLTSDSETFGVVLIEALASGLPVIATRAGGPDDIVTPEVGYLVDRGDDAGLILALEAARKRSSAEGTQWSRRCADHATRNYGNAVFAAKLEPYLRSAVGTTRAER